MSMCIFVEKKLYLCIPGSRYVFISIFSDTIPTGIWNSPLLPNFSNSNKYHITWFGKEWELEFNSSNFNSTHYNTGKLTYFTMYYKTSIQLTISFWKHYLSSKYQYINGSLQIFRKIHYLEQLYDSTTNDFCGRVLSLFSHHCIAINPPYECFAPSLLWYDLTLKFTLNHFFPSFMRFTQIIFLVIYVIITTNWNCFSLEVLNSSFYIAHGMDWVLDLTLCDDCVDWFYLLPLVQAL